MILKKRVALIVLAILMLSNTVYGFSDVPDHMWYYEDINKMKNLGVINGYADGTFKPEKSLTNSEVISLIIKVVGLDIKETLAGEHWVKGVVDAAVGKGIIDNKNIDLNRNVARLELAEMLVRALDLEENEVSLSAFKDTKSTYANILHKVGIIKGVGRPDGVYFNPEKDITRAEMATILVKVHKYLEESNEKDNGSEEQADKLQIMKVLSNAEKEIVSNPSSSEDLKKILLHMVSEYKYEYKYKTNLGVFEVDKFTQNIEKAFNEVFEKYPEYFSFLNRISTSISISGIDAEITINLSNSENVSITDLIIMQKEFHSRSEKVVKNLIETDKITIDMDEYTKAKVLFEWITQNTEYDTKYSKNSFNGYGQITTGKAVCQGYTSTYNLMSKMLGIKVEGVTGSAGVGNNKESHIWTKAVLDGKEVYIDATFGDPIPNREGYTDFSYFAANSEYLRKTHVWDLKK